MASVNSLGLHHPSALSYLNSEGAQTQSPVPDSYIWTTSGIDGKDRGEEELLVTDKCVVLSQGGAVRRVFRFDVEGESVLHAVLTWFSTEDETNGAESIDVNSPGAHGESTAHRGATSTSWPRPGGWSSRAQSYNAQQRAAGGLGKGTKNPGQETTHHLATSSQSRALVVFLRTQAHVYFLAGSNHVVHLPFEVESVMAAPRGLIIQRKLPSPAPKIAVSITPPVPPNSFVSQDTQSFIASMQAPSSPLRDMRNWKLPLLSSTMNTVMPIQTEVSTDLPRTFSLTDPLVEMGLVISSVSPEQNSHSLTPRRPSKRSRSLDQDEALLYVSSTSEIPNVSAAKAHEEPVAIAVTRNLENGTYTVWRLSFLKSKSASSYARSGSRTISAAHSRRRSSFGTVTGTGANTPIAYGARESFGGTRGQTPFSSQDPIVNSSFRQEDGISKTDDALTRSLDADLGFEGGGGPAKESRRVSSLLARADLSMNQDNLAFSDLASTHAKTSTSTRRISARKGDPTGSFAARGTNSTRLSANMPSVMPSFGARVDGSGELSNAGDDLSSLSLGEDSDDSDDFENYGSNESLRKDVHLSRLASFPIEDRGVLMEHKIGAPNTPKVFTLLLQEPGVNEEERALLLCVTNPQSKSLLTLSLRIRRRRKAYRAASTAKQNWSSSPDASIIELLPVLPISRVHDVVDAVKLVDRSISRILALHQTSSGDKFLAIRSLHGILVKVELPSTFYTHNQYQVIRPIDPNETAGFDHKQAVITDLQTCTALEHQGALGRVDLTDSGGRRHRLQIQMQPRNADVTKILEICKYVLPGKERAGDGILVCWWEVSSWLRKSQNADSSLEWTSLVVTLMSLAVGFLGPDQPRRGSKQRSRGSELRQSETSLKVPPDTWQKIVQDDRGSGTVGPEWLQSNAWNWLITPDPQHDEIHAKDSKQPLFITKSGDNLLYPKKSFLVDCVALSREFLSSPSGKAALGRRGYLPIAIDRDLSIRRTALATVLVALHLYREELKLDIATADSEFSGVSRLSPVLAQIGGWLGWEKWSWRDTGYYASEDIRMDRWVFDTAVITQLDTPSPPFDPPSIYEYLAQTASREQEPFMTLKDIVPSSHSESQRRTPESNAWRTLTPRTMALIDIYACLSDKRKTPYNVCLLMAELDVDQTFLDTLPEGVAAPLRESLAICQAEPLTTWGVKMLDLIGRIDLKLLLSQTDPKPDLLTSQSRPHHDAAKDFHTICKNAFEAEAVGSFDGSAELDRQTITRLIFPEDRRFAEASKLVQSSRTSVVMCVPEPDWSESDLLEAQKDLVQTVAIRTLAVPAGRGLLYYSARLPLLTERFPIIGFNLSCLMKPSNNTVAADKSSFTEEKVGWAFFHSGVAAGLSISREAKGIDTSWIVFNKPAELSNRHAGFLLALGLNGHLKSIAKWVAFKYLTPKHTMTSIGLLLGLSASYLGTMDTLITKLLSVHVSRMLPPGAAELNLSPLTQTTGIMGIGLLYCNTQHRRMSEIMLSEIEHIDYEDSSTPVDALRDEGYRLAAGFALGLIGLGRGDDLRGLHDMHLVERLLAIAVGTKKVSIVHILDKSTAAAVVAISLIFMKTGNRALAKKIDIPDTLVQFDYVRPDIFLLRTLAKHLIMWDEIQPTYGWMKANLPHGYRKYMKLNKIRGLRSHHLPLYNIIAGLCFSVGLRFAGSGSVGVRNILGAYLTQFMRLCRLPARTYDEKLTRSTVRNCQDLLALCAAAVMAGTGDLQIFRRLRSLHGRTDADTPYGSHLAAHIAIGVLFLGGGSFTFGTSNLAVASLLCAFYPLFPKSIIDNKSHLQAFRHFWVLATEARCLVARDVETHRPVSIPIAITMRGDIQSLAAPPSPSEGSSSSSVTAGPMVLHRIAPCLLPPLETIATVQTTSPTYWRVVLDFASNPSHLRSFKRSQTIHVRRRAAYDHYHSPNDNEDPSSASHFRAALLALDGQSQASRHPLDWLWSLKAFQDLDRAEQALVLPPADSETLQADSTTSNASRSSGLGVPWAFASTLSTPELTLVDARLVLEKACVEAGKADRLRNLLVLFAWADRAERERETQRRRSVGAVERDKPVAAAAMSGRWITREVVDRLKAAVWIAARELTDV